MRPLQPKQPTIGRTSNESNGVGRVSQQFSDKFHLNFSPSKTSGRWKWKDEWAFCANDEEKYELQSTCDEFEFFGNTFKLGKLTSVLGLPRLWLKKHLFSHSSCWRIWNKLKPCCESDLQLETEIVQLNVSKTDSFVGTTQAAASELRWKPGKSCWWAFWKNSNFGMLRWDVFTVDLSQSTLEDQHPSWYTVDFKELMNYWSFFSKGKLPKYGLGVLQPLQTYRESLEPIAFF